MLEILPQEEGGQVCSCSILLLLLPCWSRSENGKITTNIIFTHHIAMKLFLIGKKQRKLKVRKTETLTY
jgi:hypothetical protein